MNKTYAFIQLPFKSTDRWVVLTYYIIFFWKTFMAMLRGKERKLRDGGKPKEEFDAFFISNGETACS